MPTPRIKLYQVMIIDGDDNDDDEDDLRRLFIK